MRPLTPDDLLSLQEYAERRAELFASLNRYLDRHRRIRVGPELTLVFENRQTLWFRLHEVLHVARLSEPERIQEELDIYNQLLPCDGELQAALLIDIGDGSRLTERLAPWQDFTGDALQLRIGHADFPVRLVTCRPADRCLGAAHWVQVPLAEPGRKLLADFKKPARFEAAHRDYRYVSAPLNEEVRQSLLDDLTLSANGGIALKK